MSDDFDYGIHLEEHYYYYIDDPDSDYYELVAPDSNRRYLHKDSKNGCSFTDDVSLIQAEFCPWVCAEIVFELVAELIKQKYLQLGEKHWAIEEYQSPGKFKNNQGWIYLIHAEETQRYKIGKTARTRLASRIKEIQGQSPYPLEVVNAFWSTDLKTDEVSLHKKFSTYRAFGEWFEFAHPVIDLVNSAFNLKKEPTDLDRMAKAYSLK